MDLHGVTWRKSSYSGSQTSCVEVAFVPQGWRKSSYSGSQGECVEVALTPAAVGVRDTKNRDAGALVVPAPAWRALTVTLSLA